MNLYKKKSGWKVLLALAGIIIVLISMYYSNYLAERLAQGEKDKVEIFAMTIRSLNETEDLNADVTYQQLVLQIVNDVPVIMVREDGSIYGSHNFDEDANLEKELAKIKEHGLEPIQGHGYASEIYFKHTRLLSLLTYFPFVQMLLLLAFVGIGYIGFSTARKAEQNQVWVGMAKETAHQLGTPVSAIVAWIEHLKEANVDRPDQLEILDELTKDVDRLDLIADRFSKIGSKPKLESVDIIQILDEVKKYMAKRASRKIKFEFPSLDQSVRVRLNPPLFDWVAENLLRNALDAMDESGTISVTVEEENSYVLINFSDTGKGISKDNFKTVFQPGYSTKKRGWGLGLSLAKRIIENYHSGKIYVKKSELNEGTTFTIALPNA